MSIDMAGPGLQDWATLIVSLASFLAALAAVHVARRAFSVSESTYVSNLRRDWESLRVSWVRSLLLVRGADDYYIDASLEERAQVRELQLHINSPHVVQSDITDWVNRSRAETRHIRDVVRFMSHTADLVLQGRLSVTSVYGVVGPDVSRHQAALRVLCGASQQMASSEWDRFLWQSLEHAYSGEQARVLMLVDLLWSEVAARGDNDSHSLMAIAAYKRMMGTGALCRRRATRLASGHPWRQHRLRRLLRRAELLDFNVVCRPGAFIVGSDFSPFLVVRGRGPQVVKRGYGAWSAQRWMRQQVEKDRMSYRSAGVL